MYENEILLDLFQNKKVIRPPVWLMRQAGRILPQYRKVRSSAGSFKSLVKNPDLASDVTIQPVDHLDVDAAIIFSDILVIPEAMGLNYELIEKRGPIFPETISEIGQVEELKTGNEVLPNLNYVFEAVEQTKIKLENRVPLIGFCGAPWTIFSYMIEGQGSKTFWQARTESML